MVVNQPIDFYLDEVSHHKGICSNYPKGNADDKPDLRFTSPDEGVFNQAIEIDPKDPNHAYLKAPATEADVTIEATDTGAYGKFRAEAKTLGLLSLDERTGENFVRIPMDDDKNHIADGWAKRRGVMNLPPTWDEDAAPAEMPHKGDSLTLYEEYRGFVVEDPLSQQAHWTRLETKRRKTFVYPKNGHEDWIREGARLFETVTGVRVYFVPGDDYVKPDPALDNGLNWINFNSDLNDGIDFGPKVDIIPIVNTPGYVSDDPKHPKVHVFGRTMAAGDKYGVQVPDGPWQLDEIQIFPQKITASMNDEEKLYSDLAAGHGTAPHTKVNLGYYGATFQDVATDIQKNFGAMVHQLYVFSTMHEMGHALGARHHDEDHPEIGPLTCPMTYWSGRRANLPFFLGRFDPDKTAWTFPASPDGSDDTPGPGNASPWSYCQTSWSQMKLKP